MNYNEYDIREKARKYGFNVETYEKQVRLIDLLEEIDSNKYLHDRLALKGGTSINLFVFDGPRLSIDLDLDYTRDCSKEEMLKDREQIKKEFKKIMDKCGYVLGKKSRTSYITDKPTFEYVDINNKNNYIKLDINYLDRCHVLPLERQKLKAKWSEKKISFQCVNTLEIFASKIVALCDRAALRDLYDVKQLIEKLDLNKDNLETLHRCVVLYSCIGSKNIDKTLSGDMLRDINRYRIRTELEPVMLEREKINLKDYLKKVEPFLDVIHNLNSREELFVELFKEGDYRPDLVFDGEELDRIYNHPMAERKMAYYRIQQLNEDGKEIDENEQDGPELGD